MKIDIHTHIMPAKMPNWTEKFGYGEFIHLEHRECDACMMKGDKVFRVVGENTFKEVKSAGYWKIDKGAKQISFYGGLKPKDLDVLGKVKNCGFYSPLIQGYRWLFSEDFEFDSMQFIDVI